MFKYLYSEPYLLLCTRCCLLLHAACLPGFSVRQAAAVSTVTEHGSMRYHCDKCPVGYISTGGPFAAKVQCHPCPAGSSTAAPGSRLCDGERLATRLYENGQLTVRQSASSMYPTQALLLHCILCDMLNIFLGITAHAKVCTTSCIGTLHAAWHCCTA
jgi:hypothetical protein